MKVIIADDEDKICQLIYKLVDWEAMDMQVAAIVHNGIEALQAIAKHDPDIVITDIRMPGFDGLEMISKAKEISGNIDFIIISGYRHFEYAQNALRFGVKEYLLKPIKKVELEETLFRIRENYLKRTEMLTNEEKNRLTVKNSVDKLRSAFFTEVLFKKGKSKEEMNIDSINEEFHFLFKEGYFQIIIFKIDGVDYSFQSNFSYIQDKVLQCVHKQLEKECFDTESIVDGTTCFTIINYDIGSKKNIRKKLKNVQDELLLQKEILENLQITIGAGVVKESIAEIMISFKTAIWAMEQRIMQGVNRLIEGEEVSLNELADSRLFYEFNKQMVDSLERMDEKELSNALQYLQKELKSKENTSGHEVIQMMKEAMNLFLVTMKQNKLNIKDVDTYFEKFILNIENIGYIDEMFSYLTKTMVTSFRQAILDKQLEDNKPIRDAKQYIKKQYKKSITLEIVSEYIGFNATYFSSLFKKETGITFSEYLTSVRMEKAKELLKETNMSVSSICEEVGYNDYKNFTKGFNKYTNLKPNEYRKIYS